MSNVVHAFGAAPPSQLEQEMLERIEAFIGEIKAGRVVGIALAAVLSDGGVSTGWTRAPLNHFGLIGAVQRLNQRLLEDGRDL